MSKKTNEDNIILSSKTVRLDTIDGLRGLAIILVMWFHIYQQSWLPNHIKLGSFNLNFDFIPFVGFLGVDLFFFLSAFCLFYPYAKSKFEGAPEQSLKRFAYRRFIKIVPSYYLALILMAIVMWHTKFQTNSEGIIHMLKHFTFTNCFFEDTYYGSINPVFWSTAVEVQFYLLFPFICYIFRKKPIATYLTMFAVGCFYRYYVFTYQNAKLSILFNQLPGVIDIFAAGMLASYLMVYMRSRIRDIDALKPFLTFTSIIAMIVFSLILKWGYTNNYGNIQVWQIKTRHYLGWLFIILTVSACFSANAWKKVIANKLFVFASTISYNLYIWHQWIDVQLKARKIPSYVGNDPHLDFKWQISYTIISILVGVIIATVITYCFERPLLDKGFKGCFKEIKENLTSKTNNKKISKA